MNVKIYKEAVPSFDAAVIPFSDEQLLNTELPEVISGPVKAALSAGKLAAACGSVYDPGFTGRWKLHQPGGVPGLCKGIKAL